MDNQWLSSAKAALKQYFGYSSFRQGQEELIGSLLSGRDAVGVMPTGAGKSLCFQIPALLMEGVTVVVSPLISLMKDQVGALVQAGVPVAYINSSLTAAQYRETMMRARTGGYRILYVAPERLPTPDFLRFAREAAIPLVAVDEAHCISQWGQDFRPSYLRIREFIDALPVRPVIGAFTATATAQVREDITAILRMKNPALVTTGFNRQNLYFEVRHPADKKAALLRILREEPDRSGVVYCATRKTVEEVCADLCGAGIEATRYHAGLPEEERRRNQDDFLYDRRRVMVATNAFGMGIDKSNVSFVVHYNMPKNMESYYQEAGRAGRDGEPARCILLYSGQDVVTNQFLIDRSGGEELDEDTRREVREKDRERLRLMTFYCHTGDCLREYILRYFGEKPPNYCGNCGNCLRNFEEIDVTVEAQKILSCIRRAGERYGVKMIVDILRGSKNERLLRLGLDGLSTYGIMADCREKRLRDILQFLLLQGYLQSTDDEYPVLKLTPRSREVLVGGARLRMKAAKEEERESHRSAASASAEENPALFAQLREVRARLADRQGVPAFVIFTDAALRDMCARLPRTEEEFLGVSGVGQAKLQRYGREFLPVIREYARERRESSGQ